MNFNIKKLNWVSGRTSHFSLSNDVHCTKYTGSQEEGGQEVGRGGQEEGGGREAGKGEGETDTTLEGPNIRLGDFRGIHATYEKHFER